MNEQIYTNYRLQLPQEEILGTLVVRDRLITDIQPGVVAIGQDGGGDYLLPGLIELHTDNLECCVSPRPGVCWSVEAAAAYHDRAIIIAGITTVCDAIAVGSVNPDSLRLTHFTAMIDAICHGQAAGHFVAGLQVLVGAPNLVLGGSQSGNVAAKELIEQGLVDIISSDYAPQSLLHAIFLISRYLNQPIYKVMRLATSNPAQAIHLEHDRGSLTVGKQADLIAVRDRSVPQLTAVICRGDRVA